MEPVPEFSPLTDRTIGELFVLQHGRFWTPGPRPVHVPRGRPGICYFDAALRAFDDPSATYVEGIGWLDGLSWTGEDGVEHQLWTKHAWTVDATGLVTDATWETPERCHYFGVPIPREIAIAQMRTEFGGVFECDDDGYMDCEFYDELTLAIRAYPGGGRQSARRG
jgi:hypothetical protein